MCVRSCECVYVCRSVCVRVCKCVCDAVVYRCTLILLYCGCRKLFYAVLVEYGLWFITSKCSLLLCIALICHVLCLVCRWIHTYLELHQTFCIYSIISKWIGFCPDWQCNLIIWYGLLKMSSATYIVFVTVMLYKYSILQPFQLAVFLVLEAHPCPGVAIQLGMFANYTFASLWINFVWISSLWVRWHVCMHECKFECLALCFMWVVSFKWGVLPDFLQ